MADTPLENLRADDSINTDDDLKIGALADGLASGGVNEPTADSDGTSHGRAAGGDNKAEAKESSDDRGNHPCSDNELAAPDEASGSDNPGMPGDVTLDLGGDPLSSSLNLDHILNHSQIGFGNDGGFSIVQANSLADQDHAYSIKMNSSNADNVPAADRGHAESGDGTHFGAISGWDLKVGHELDASSTADASASLANAGFHQEIVQGANLLSNAVDVNVVGGDLHATSIGQDSDG
ncbi:hypothetical protein [Sinorhizobium psoraleae]|uniref:Fibrinogen-binding protein n=1 Tax=Sinorhizobium psoraleae TaxID=520838 RepID=A0ABT4KHD2_9HYPH|nr:hypothetical protein [Sinorhizobium psoraleae]MCZ4091375.1 hypothetical protein [Sinorhizobium psoraleae]